MDVYSSAARFRREKKLAPLISVIDAKPPQAGIAHILTDCG